MFFMVVGAGALSAQPAITIKGKVKFPAEQGNMNMEVVESRGFDKITHASVPLRDDGTYELSFRVERPGAYMLNCQNQDRVTFWAEDENLEIDFRGRDTARVRYIGPTYTHIKGGPNNELMNMVNWENFRNYWTGADISNVPYREERITDDLLKQELSGRLRDINSKDYFERMYHLARYYADCNSAVTLLSTVKRNEAVYNELLARLDARDPNYGPLVRYKQELADNEAQERRLAEGNPAPKFLYPTPDGKKKLGPDSYKGKILVIDFWASWCGPCRAEIPHLKEAYEQFHGKGVEILSVSIDGDDAKWRKAMQEEQMPWPQVKAPDVGKEAMSLYQFSGIPHIVIIDQKGNIVGKNYRGALLIKKLDELTGGKPAGKPASIPMIGM